MYPHIKTQNALTIVIDGKNHSITSDHTMYEKVLDIVRNVTPCPDTDEELVELMQPVKQFLRILGTENEGFVLDNNVVKAIVDGHTFPLPNSLHKEILNVYNTSSNLRPLHNFVQKLAKNPRKEVIDELWGFISSCGLSITEEGNFLAYKNVNNDFMDVYTGTMSNKPGTLLSMPRWEVEHDPNKTCAPGLHFAAWGYLKSYAPGRKTVLVSISPEDVVSIPTDYNNMKGRACRYKILREVDQPEELKSMHVYKEDNELTDTSEADSTWIKWSKQDRKSGSEPENFDTLVEVRLKYGTTETNEVQYFQWGQLLCKDSRIVAYRYIK